MPIADRLTKARMRVRTSWSITWRNPAKVADPVLPASHRVVTPVERQKWSVCPPMSCALTKTWAWMSMRPGVTKRPRALIVRRASLSASEGATSTILPPLTPTSSRPFSPAPGSMTSPCRINRSYFMFHPSAASPECCASTPWSGRRRHAFELAHGLAAEGQRDEGADRDDHENRAEEDRRRTGVRLYKIRRQDAGEQPDGRFAEDVPAPAQCRRELLGDIDPRGREGRQHGKTGDQRAGDHNARI